MIKAIEDLILKLCPYGITQVPIGSLITRVRNKGKSDDSVSQVYVVSNTRGMVRAEDFRENTIHSQDTSNYTIIRPYMVAYNPSRLNIGSIAMLKSDIPGLVSPMYVVFAVDDKKVEYEYFEHIMKSHFVNYKINSLKEEGARFRFDYERWNKIIIPLPPKEIQHEIIFALKKFDDIIKSLEDELNVRREQYYYYLNTCLDINRVNVQKVLSVGELFDIKNGLNKEKEAFGKGTPIINFTDVYNKRFLTEKDIKGRVSLSKEEIERYGVRKGDVFFTRTSETKEDVGMASVVIEEIEDCVFSGFVLRARPKTDLLLPKFCSYFFATEQVRNVITRYASVTTRATTTGPKLSKIMVPIMGKEEQKQIVDRIEKFDFICNDIESGLIAEIEIRKRQLGYYREKMLGF